MALQLDFIRVEFAPSIHEDRIQSASFYIKGGCYSGYPLDAVLEQLLKITITRGIEAAVAAFDKCTQNTSGVFQYMALLHGIKVDTEIQIFEGIKLVPLSNSSSDLPNYLPPQREGSDLSVGYLGKTLLIIDASISPIFHRPYSDRSQDPFQVEVNGKKFMDSDRDNFYNTFCQALSLACNIGVEIPVKWQFLAEDELFSLNFRGVTGSTHRIDVAPFPSHTKVTETEINEAKRLYNILTNFNRKTLEKLQIPIDRWIKSKTSQTAVDKIIDLGIALEALYLSETDYNREIRFRFSLHAAWHLGKDKEHRKALMKEFKAIYDWRSTVVHTGKLPNKTKRTPFTPDEVTEFITKAQDLCRDSILKILEDGKHPDWNDLILGEESS